MDPSTISQEIRYKPHFLGIYKTGRQNWGFWGEIHIAPKGTYTKAFYLCHGGAANKELDATRKHGKLGKGQAFYTTSPKKKRYAFSL